MCQAMQFLHPIRCHYNCRFNLQVKNILVVMGLTDCHRSPDTEFIKLKGSFLTTPKEDRSFTIDDYSTIGIHVNLIVAYIAPST